MNVSHLFLFGVEELIDSFCLEQPLYSFKPDTSIIFNHVDFTVSYHGGKTESWGAELGDDIGRILSALSWFS